MKMVNGGVCAAKGFKAAGIHAGIKEGRTKYDLSLITSDVRATAAAVYTTNLVKGAPITVTKEHIADGFAQAVVCNSVNANTCNADGIDVANAMCKMVEDATGIPANDVIIGSTGVIGQPLPLEPIRKAMPELAKKLSVEGSMDAEKGIMTTDTVPKEFAVEFELSGKVCHMGAIGKGSGMIHPNMATMLIWITTDAAISSEMLQKALSEDIPDTFNMISVDGDTSTNDTVAIMANGLAGNEMITGVNEDYLTFAKALNFITTSVSKAIAKDGEGATKLLECNVKGALNKDAARTIAKSVICSSLVKAAFFGADANWGRILCAIGYSKAPCDITKVDVTLSSVKGSVHVCENGAGVPFSEEIAKEVLLEDEITIDIILGDGSDFATAWGCDLTYDYVKINGDYRT